MSFAPPPSSPPPPPGPPADAIPPPPPSYQGQSHDLTGRPPRPNVRLGAGLLMVGAITHGAAAFMPWFTYQGKSFTGRDDFVTSDLKVLQSPGNFWLFFAVVLFSLGLALFLAGRVLPVAIISVVVAAIAAFFSLIGVGAAGDMKDFLGEGTIGAGAIVGIVSALVALAGSITALAKRRR